VVSGVLQYNVEANEGMSAWVIGQFLTRKDLLDGGCLVKVHDGPYVQSYRWTRTVSNSKLELDITLRQGTPRVEYRLRVDWREMGHAERGIPHLRVRFPLAVQDPQARYEIPYGSIQRDLFDGEEVPAQRWADVRATGFLGRDGPGVTLVNASKYGHSLEGDTLGLTLLRASIEPDPLPDLGEHVIDYALAPHGAEWTVGDGMRAGEEMNVPLVVASCGFQEGDLPSALSFVAVEPVNVRLVALKRGQGPVRGTQGPVRGTQGPVRGTQGPVRGTQGVVLRLIEVEGQESEAQVSLASALVPEGATAVEVDTLERPVEGGSARLEGGTLIVRLPAYGIVTVHVS
jgi:alpha-mannosidase